MAPRTLCPAESRWRDFLAGNIPAPVASILAKHLDGCGSCQQLLERLTTGTEPWLDAARTGREQPGPDGPLRQVIQRLKAEGEPVDAVPAEAALDFLEPAAPGSGFMGRLGGYDVVKVIGRGGMGVVLKAFDAPLNRFVAIKVLAPGLASTSTARERFSRETRATAAVRHDNVVAIYRVDAVNSVPYLVMEYVHGTSLQERLDRSGPLGMKEVLRIGMQVAAGLAAAHAQGLVHRDVKPSNILLENGVERVKLSDFGLARAVDDASLTQSGVIAGTPQYMAPEQANGEALDHRTDLFSLGSVLYAMCTGRPPFRAPNTLAVLKRVCEDEPRPVREVNADVPEWLAVIIGRLHAKSRKDRFQSAAEVSELLGRYLAHMQHPGHVPQPPCARPAPAPRKKRRRRAVWLLLLLAAAVLFCPCLGVLSMWSMSVPKSAVAVRSATVVNEQVQGVRIVLHNGKLHRDGDDLRFEVDFELMGVLGPAADVTERYIWVVRRGGKTIFERELKPNELGQEGTLQGQTPAAAGAAGPVEMFLESRRLVAGQMAGQRLRISNLVTLEP